MRIPFLSALSLLILLLSGARVYAQGRATDFPNYGLESGILAGTPGIQGGSAAGFWNPAAWSAIRYMDCSFQWDDRNFHSRRLDTWAFAMGGSGVGFTVRRNPFQYTIPSTDPGLPLAMESRLGRVTDYQLSVGGKNKNTYWGFSWTWSNGDIDQIPDATGRDDYWTLGNITRPVKYLSIGNALSLGIHDSQFRGISDIGFRPFGTHRLTLFGDAAYTALDNWNSLQWGIGAETQPMDGIAIALKITKPYAELPDKIYSLCLGFTMNHNSIQIVPQFDRNADNQFQRTYTRYMYRGGLQQPSFDIGRPFHRDPRPI